MSHIEALENQAGRQTLLYRETFDVGPAGWTVGKDKEDGGFNRNVLGFRGDAVPLGWSATGGLAGGFVYSESPWYFDSNHGMFMWFYMIFISPFVQQPEWESVQGADLRDALLRITIRATDLELRGTRLYFWIQGRRGEHPRAIYNPGDPLVNWALASRSIEEELLDGRWHAVELTLHNDEDRWSQMGLLNRGLPRKVVVEHSLTASTGTLDYLLNGHHHNIGFILGGVDPNDPPNGRIDVDEINIWANHR